MAVKFKFIVDADGNEVDRIEYDDAAIAKPVKDMMDNFGWDEAKARAFCANEEPGSEKSNAENAADLAEQIVAKSVPDRPEDTYGAEDSVLSVQDTNPTPAVATSLNIIPASIADAQSTGTTTEASE